MNAALVLVLCYGSTASRASSNELARIKLAADVLSDIPSKAEIASCALNAVTGSLTVFGEDEIDRRRSPWSTFKIPNLIIALESGVAEDLNHRRVWDRQRRPAAENWPLSWQQDHTLATAFRHSAVWYFQDVASEVGTKSYRSTLRRFGYGNELITENSDQFWLGGPLAISPREQATFLMRVLDGSLVISDRTMAAVREVSLMKVAGDYSLYGKTGSGNVNTNSVEGWLIGWVERQQAKIATFAFYMRVPDFGSLRSARGDLAEQLLLASGYLPEDWR